MTADPLDWFSLRFPRTVDADAVVAGLVALNGLSRPGYREAIVFQVTGGGDLLEHHVGLPHERAVAGREQLARTLAGLELDVSGPPPIPATASVWHIWLSTRRRPLDTTGPEPIAQRVLVALAGADHDEQVVLRWVLGPVRRPLVVGTKGPTSKTETVIGALTAPLVPPGVLDGEARRALRDKQSRPGWRALGAIAIKAASIRRERQLLARLVGALRTAQAPGVQLGVRRSLRGRGQLPERPLRWPFALNVDELAGLIAFPIGETNADLPVRRRTSRLLPPPAGIPGTGRIVAEGIYPEHQRPLALSASDATFHMHLLGPTGSGKSVLIANLALQDVADGRGVVVIDPKGDLVSDLLSRVPDRHLEDVVVLDPADASPVGLNPLAEGAAPELLADQLLAVFRGLYESWGPRVQDVLTASLITLARSKDMTLAALPLLLTNPAFRRRLVSRLDDPLGLGSFWSGYEALTEAERLQVIAPALNRVRPFLLRPQLRAVVGQARPRFRMAQIFTERKILLVSLARGVLGPDVANLLGGLVVSQLWNAILARQRVPAERRRPVLVYIDEFQDVIHLNTPLPDVLAQARGMGVGFTLAHQHLGQLPPDIKAAVLGNARSRVVWQLGADDAAVIARSTPLLTTEDVTSLERFEVYLSLVHAGRVSPFMSGRTRPLPPPANDPDDVRALSRQRYGVARGDIEGQLRQALQLHELGDLSDVGTKRRRS